MKCIKFKTIIRLISTKQKSFKNVKYKEQKLKVKTFKLVALIDKMNDSDNQNSTN